MTTRAYTSRAAAILLAVAGAAGAASANDALIAYEGFNYGATANLAGANGGTGWGSAWFKLSDIPTGVTLEGLSWPGLPTSGGSAFTAGYPSSGYTRYSRVLDTYVAPNDEVYVSFLFRPNVGYGVGGGLAFGTWENGMIVGIIPGSGQYGLSGLPGTPASETTTPVVQDETVLLVARVTKEPGDMIMWSLFVNPSIGEIAPVTPDATLAIPGTALPPALFLYNDGGFSTDEIRLGATWASVLGQPELCPADLDGDSIVGITDLLALLAAWGTNPSGPPDFDGDGNVGIVDFLELLANWGPCS